MSRKLKASVAQLGPIHLADTRSVVVKRLMALMREAHASGAEFPRVPLVVNLGLRAAARVERWWIHRAPLPVGLSIVAVLEPA